MNVLPIADYLIIGIFVLGTVLFVLEFKKKQ